MAILNTRNVFGPPAWAPVVNNIVAIATLGLYVLVPGELSMDPVEMGNAKLLVLGIGTTLGVFAQTAVLLVAIRQERVSLRPLWGIDDRLKKFGTMAAAMVLYVLISQIGLIVGNQIASERSGFRPGHLQLHLAGADAAVRHDRRDGTDGGDAAAEPQRRGQRHPGGARRSVAGHPADDGDADSDRRDDDRRWSRDRQRAVRLRQLRRGRRRLPRHGDHAVRLHA